MTKTSLSLVAFVIAAVFFALDVITVQIGDMNQLAAGLLAMAVGFLIEKLP